ncbi:WcaG Nucleoside-diphosphate-sugar epimerases [Burkholderiales bacterium]|jgi:GDP-L-fucose synthase
MKIYVAGHRGMVGSAIVRGLGRVADSDHNFFESAPEIITRSRNELDLLDQSAVAAFLAREKPDYVFMAAARVGGIHANNSYRAEFIYENLMIEANVIHGAFKAGIANLMFLGSSCIYPRDCPQPIKEESLLTGPLEQTNEPYALAKIAGVKLAESYNRQYGMNYVSLMPTNLYGPGDNYDLENSHVLPALIRKAHEAKARGLKSLSVWGSGLPRREFLHVDDLADACFYFMQKSVSDFKRDGSVLPLLNIGVGQDQTIQDLAQMVMKAVGFQGVIEFDPSKPDGTPRKLLDVSRANGLGWRAKMPINQGIANAYEDFLSRYS